MKQILLFTLLYISGSSALFPQATAKDRLSEAFCNCVQEANSNEGVEGLQTIKDCSSQTFSLHSLLYLEAARQESLEKPLKNTYQTDFELQDKIHKSAKLECATYQEIMAAHPKMKFLELYRKYPPLGSGPHLGIGTKEALQKWVENASIDSLTSFFNLQGSSGLLGAELQMIKKQIAKAEKKKLKDQQFSRIAGRERQLWVYAKAWYKGDIRKPECRCGYEIRFKKDPIFPWIVELRAMKENYLWICSERLRRHFRKAYNLPDDGFDIPLPPESD